MKPASLSLGLGAALALGTLLAQAEPPPTAPPAPSAAPVPPPVASVPPAGQPYPPGYPPPGYPPPGYPPPGSPPPGYPPGSPPPGYPPGYPPPGYAPPGYPPGYPPPMASGYPYPPYPYPPYGWAPPAATAPPPAEPVTREERYGTSIVIADAIAGVVMLGGLIGDSQSALRVGAAGYSLASPIVHFTHRNVGKGFASFGIRIGAIYTAYAGSVIFSRGDCDARETTDKCRQQLAGVGLVVFGAATALDAVLLARKTVEVKPTALTVMPTVASERGTTTLGLVGTW